MKKNVQRRNEKRGKKVKKKDGERGEKEKKREWRVIGKVYIKKIKEKQKWKKKWM